MSEQTMAELTALTRNVLDCNPGLEIIAYSVGEYGVEEMIGDDGIRYGYAEDDPAAADLTESLVRRDRWLEWRTGEAFREELTRNGDKFAPMFGIRGWVYQYCGLGHFIMVRREYWEAFERERSGLRRGNLYSSFPDIMMRVLDK